MVEIKVAKKKVAKKKKVSNASGSRAASMAKYPRHSLEKALRIPRVILEQNAGKECTEKEAAVFLGLASPRGPFRVEISSGLKFGLLDRPSTGKIAITDLAKKILRPQNTGDEIEGLRAAVLKAPDVSDVYNHYRGENLPDDNFFNNALVDNFKIPQEKINEFKTVFSETLEKAKLIEEKMKNTA
jgi:hypothetical protein